MWHPTPKIIYPSLEESVQDNIESAISLTLLFFGKTIYAQRGKKRHFFGRKFNVRANTRVLTGGHRVASYKTHFSNRSACICSFSLRERKCRISTFFPLPLSPPPPLSSSVFLLFKKRFSKARKKCQNGGKLLPYVRNGKIKFKRFLFNLSSLLSAEHWSVFQSAKKTFRISIRFF